MNILKEFLPRSSFECRRNNVWNKFMHPQCPLPNPPPATGGGGKGSIFLAPPPVAGGGLGRGRNAGKLSVILLTIAAAQLAACASQPTIRSNADPAADFSRYKSYGFLDEGNRRIVYDSFANQYIKKAVNREMEMRGFQHGENPDLLVNIHVQTKDKVKVTESPGGYYGYRGGYYGWGAGMYTTVDNYTEGTLNIDVVDRAQSRLLWEGIAVGKVSEKARDNPQPAIDEVVKQVFERFPKQPPQPQQAQQP